MSFFYRHRRVQPTGSGAFWGGLLLTTVCGAAYYLEKQREMLLGMLLGIAASVAGIWLYFGRSFREIDEGERRRESGEYDSDEW